MFMAICYKSQNRIGQAINILEDGLIKYPRFSQAYFYKGKMHIKLGEYQFAAQSFRKCIKLQSNNSELSFLMLGDCLKHLGKFE